MVQRWIDEYGTEFAFVCGYDFETRKKEIAFLKKEGFTQECLMCAEQGTTYEEYSLVRYAGKKAEEKTKGVSYLSGVHQGEQT